MYMYHVIIVLNYVYSQGQCVTWKYDTMSKTCRSYSRPGLPRYIAICDISRYFFIYRDMRYIAIFFWSYRDTNVHGYTEIDGRIDGESRKYTNSHSADATSVGPH